MTCSAAKSPYRQHQGTVSTRYKPALPEKYLSNLCLITGLGYSMNSPSLKNALLVGVVYFVCMAVAHYIGIKQPLLFIYYDTPFYAYQDKIISFAVIAYAALFYSAAYCRAVVPAALFVLGITVFGLASINSSEELRTVLTEEQATTPYWAQTELIAVYFVLLLLLYVRDR